MITVFATVSIQADETDTSSQTGISHQIADGSRAIAAPVAKPLEFSVKKTSTVRMEVQEPSEIPGLPAVNGTITATVQMVEDPGLVDPPLLPDPAKGTDRAVQNRLADRQGELPQTQIILVSATVYGHEKTFLRWCLPGPEQKEMGAWSNLDFNHFGGFSTYQVKGSDGKIREYVLLLALGNEEGQPPDAIPALPDFLTAGPGFVVTEGDTSDRDGMHVIEGMHDLYRVEGERMKIAYLSRIKAQEERKAEWLANPKAPEDVVIQFWKRKQSLAKAAQAQPGITTP